MVFCKSAILESDNAIFRGTVRRRSPFLMGKEGGRKIFLRSGRIFLSEGEMKYNNYSGQLVRVGRKFPAGA